MTNYILEIILLVIALWVVAVACLIYINYRLKRQEEIDNQKMIEKFLKKNINLFV